ncbi:MAG TPA: hypothetical protein VGP06_12035 [Janthinobacterium sp.]|jgi:hypothetical protein|nr:hypothetical protein [Janthinobacterium sp.]
MAHTLHRNFKEISDAEGARSALLAAGFHASAVQLNLHTVDPSKTSVTTATVENIMQGLTRGPKVDFASIRKAAALLSVDIDTDDERAKAEAIMLRYGATEA